MNSLWRIIDANFNRSREGLRVCEDVARFTFNNSSLSASLKAKRHKLNQIFFALGKRRRRLLESREADRDVGKKGFIWDQKRATNAALLESNFKRVEEALRVLEECMKMTARQLVPKVQALRFEVYELEKRALTKF